MTSLSLVTLAADTGSRIN
ncbi:hypothetical protein YPPY32_3003, partial [Yersinia pestis PY-32]